ncbi:cytochrome C oxidase subunit III [Helicobacter sp. CLO-3]|nr:MULTISPECIES: c-type cytochrome [unclassified Helicobacter]OBV29896.1 cytochrome C oxidase subunit III [Helicobacter sp. CLO-3]OHU83715.1 cytochrome C oxidase subunit III [Helicobacter sp. CLO-3]
MIENDSFITPQEYGASLYENPRGIGCVKCHGKDGEETLLASYIHKGKQKHVIIPRINNLDFQAFKKALSIDKGIMPKYGLTDEEINAIYLYITSRNKTFR